MRLLRRVHGGVAGARNLGVREATGDFVHFLDSDDLLLPQAITPLLMLGGAYLCYEGAEKVYEYFFPHDAHAHEAELEHRLRTGELGQAYRRTRRAR